MSSGPAVALSMIIHELSTNALKYGALSVAEGRVAITWSIDAENQRFHLEWRERGGPRVVEPAKKNFGSRFIQTALPGQLKGEARLLFESTGVVCDINIPLSSLQETIIAVVD
ncbi:two-component sensor histidine kinase [Bradyrhizobium sp. GM7.3]